jgi:hypothetical protein
MPEVQSATALGEMTQRFIEFVMMQAQQAAMFLGRIPNPQTGQPEVNLELARLFIDQLEMVREKTRGNLSKEESEILTRVLSDLQLTFVQASGGAAPEAIAPAAPAPEPSPEPAAHEAVSEEPAPDQESRKKFTKSYGA